MKTISSTNPVLSVRNLLYASYPRRKCYYTAARRKEESQLHEGYVGYRNHEQMVCESGYKEIPFINIPSCAKVLVSCISQVRFFV